MKKIVWLLIVFLLFTISLSFSKTTINFWYALSGNSGSVFKGIVDEFNSTNEEIYVNAIYSGKYADTAQKVTASLASDTLPDGGIIPAGPIFTGARDNYLILEYIENDTDFIMTDFYDAMWDYSKYNGKICAIPYNISTPILYYNKDLMKGSGLDPENPPRNWDELIEFSKKISKDKNGDGIMDVWGLNIADVVWIFKAFLYQNNCEIIDSEKCDPLFNNENGIEAAKYWKKLIEENAMPVGMHALAEKMFLSGNLGFYIGTSSRIGKWHGNTQFDLGVAFIPKGKRYGVPIGGAVAVIFPKNKEIEDATYEFIKYLVSPDKIAEFSAKTGYIPIRKSTLKEDEIKELFKNNPLYEIPFKQLDNAFSYWHFDQMGNMDSLFWEAIENIERNVFTPEEAMNDIAKRLKEEM